ncbi:hypothetical protein BDY21DRAFT_277905 [Lineolata rhizophorae]|uniref:Capsule polysaccharide biosynthesis protein n=1 Tax=Lineolata rhizophorae TaxID=578093 RepID=A0A6A6PEI3_9PEZI|nr:hypothetical protein BDY21DRAFT_277905 [Lineolata rhizophorae]
MTALQRAATTTSAVGVAAWIAPKLWRRAARFVAWPSKGSAWRIVALILMLINFKNLPFVWHFRLFRSYIYQIYLQPTPLPPRALFQPLVTRCARAPLSECDYNIHKSNSTYFTDADNARMQYMAVLLRTHNSSSGTGATANSAANGAANTGAGAPPAADGVGDNFIVALGAISCHFRREIKPYAGYEMWTRLLSWDRKWLYTITHFVAPGSGAPPSSYTLQPWRTPASSSRAGAGAGAAADPADPARAERLKKAVFATSIAKYVVKNGRLTVPPERVLADSGLLPPRPADKAEADDLVFSVESGAWTWEKVEEERVRGLRLAEMFNSLDGLHDEFTGGASGVLGEYNDLAF